MNQEFNEQIKASLNSDPRKGRKRYARYYQTKV